MQMFGSLMYALLSCCLLAAKAWALSGPETAQALNQRLEATAIGCVANQPEYACSGVMAKPIDARHSPRFWEHDSASIASGSEVLIYLRSDVVVAPPAQPTGYVLMSQFDALVLGKPYEIESEQTAGEVQVRNWDDSLPARLAVEALYYDPEQPGALLKGQRSQLEWYNATNTWLPLLRIGTGGFGFDQREQLYDGYRIASEINARFADTSPACPDGRARYHCQGVLVRSTNVGNFKAWNPSPTSQRNQAVSFSYFAADAGLSVTVWPQGFIVFPLGYPANEPLAVSCIYPFDGGTSINNQPCTEHGVCAGITDKQTWLARYAAPTQRSCAFRTDSPDFHVAVQAHKWSLEGREVARGYGWNEPVVRTWAQNRAAALPLEAFFYNADVHYPPTGESASAYGLRNARRFQQDFISETQRYLPLLRLNPKAPDGKLVTYHLEDQLAW